MISENEALDLWHRALSLPMGLAIRTDHRENLRSRLYQVRARAEEPELYDLQVGFCKRADWMLIHFKTGPINTKPLEEADLDSL